MVLLIKKHYKKRFICKECRIEMKTLRELRAHFVTEHWKVENPNNIDECSICDRRVIRYTSHISRHHIDHILYCKLCSESFTTEKDVTSHMTQRHSTPDNSIFNVVESAFQSENPII